MTNRQDENDSGDMTEAELVRRLGELPRRVEPRNDPWPRIHNRISQAGYGPAQSGNPWLKVAAGVAIAFALGVYLGNSRELFAPGNAPGNGPGEQVARVNDDPINTPNLGGVLTGAEREYQAAFSEFAIIGRSAPDLKPATLEAIQHGWDEMLEAESALSNALEEYPNNPWLNKRMLELRERQLAMLQQLAGLDRTSRRTQI